MYITSGIEFADYDLVNLRVLVEIVDLKISEIKLLIEKSSDPDSDGLWDRGEYFIGIGFVAMQQYLVNTLLFTGLEKHEAYKLGLIHSSGVSYASLINSCANWWKHESEWYDKEIVKEFREKTFLQVKNIAKSPGYELSNVLAAICGTEKFSLNSVIPYLLEWRAEIHKTRNYNSIDDVSREF